MFSLGVLPGCVNIGIQREVATHCGGASPCSWPVAHPFTTGACQTSLDSPHAPTPLPWPGSGVAVGLGTVVGVDVGSAAHASWACRAPIDLLSWVEHVTESVSPGVRLNC